MPSGKHLTEEQKQLVIKLKAQGLSRKQIAGQLRLSVRAISRIW